MNRIKLKGIKMCVIKVFTLSIFSFALFNPFASANIVLSNSTLIKIDKENNDKIITNVKSSYNPVVSQIIVSYHLAKQTNVSIKLMDALGNEVLNLFNGSLEEGNQNHLFDTSEKVTPGFYFLRVASGSETVVKRISVK